MASAKVAMAFAKWRRHPRSGNGVCATTNVWMYPFWRVPERLVDVYKYYFFHTLSIMGVLVSGALDMSQHCIIAQYGRLNA